MTVFLQCIVLSYAINLIETTKLLPIPSMSASDLIVDTDKAFALQRIGTYSTKLKEEIIHTFVPLDDLCFASSKTDLCAFTAGTTGTNMLGIATIVPSRDAITVLPRYDKDQVSNIVENDIVRIRRPDQFIAKANSIIHLIDDQFHVTNSFKSPYLIQENFSLTVINLTFHTYHQHHLL